MYELQCGLPAQASRQASSVAFWAASSKTQIEEEVLLYPFTSLIAEFGGSFGLFLGFSFLAMNDIILHRVVSFGITLYCILLHGIPLCCMPGPNKVVLFHSINSNAKKPDY